MLKHSDQFQREENFRAMEHLSRGKIVSLRSGRK